MKKKKTSATIPIIIGVLILFFIGVSSYNKSAEHSDLISDYSSTTSAPIESFESSENSSKENTTSDISVDHNSSTVTISSDNSEPETDSNKNNRKLIVHFIDVGQGDCSFIELPNGKTMLIDAGESDVADKITTYIFEQGYDKLDYVVATHAHDDHIGAMAEVLNNFPVGDFYTTDFADSKTHSEAVSSTEKSGGTVHKVMAGDVIFNEHNLLIEVVAPKEQDDNTNNNSIVIKLTYGENKFLFTGDAEKSEEDDIWTNIKCDVLKVGHHGSSTSSSDNFLKKVEPEFAVISVGLNNSYSHPSPAVTERLNNRNIDIFRTDLQGTIVFTSDGTDISVNVKPWEYTPPADNSESEESEFSNNTGSESDSSITYVLNTHTKRIHYPWCNSVKDIKGENKAYTDDLKQAINDGYKSCGNCHAGENY